MFILPFSFWSITFASSQHSISRSCSQQTIILYVSAPILCCWFLFLLSLVRVNYKNVHFYLLCSLFGCALSVCILFHPYHLNFPIFPVCFKVGFAVLFFVPFSLALKKAPDVIHTNDICRDTFALLKWECGKITFEIFQTEFTNRKVLFEFVVKPKKRVTTATAAAHNRIGVTLHNAKRTHTAHTSQKCLHLPPNSIKM